MKKLKLISIFLLLINSFIFKSQTLEDNALQRKVKTSNSNNLGKVDLNIPLYNVSIPGYSFSASLDYLQERLIGDSQKKETTIVGTNWNLNSIGKIVISNSNLDIVTSPQTTHWTPDGFFSAQYDNCLIPQTTSSISKKQILDNPNSNLTSYEPNIFYFDFMGNKGYFVYDNNGKFLVNSESDIFQITFNGSKCHDVFSPINEFPEIIIKDSKGNQFYFGGDYNSTNVNFNKVKYDYYRYYDNGTFVSTESFFTNKQINYLSTLYLKKIKLANNKTIDFFYKNSNKSILDSFTNGGIYINGDYNTNSNIPSNSILLNNNIYLGGVSGISYTDTGGTTSWTNTATTRSAYTKFAILDSIKISDVGTLDFSYVQLNTDNTKPFLKKIELKEQGKIIKKIDFDYLINNNYVYLKTLTLNNESYSFDYFDYTNSLSLNGGLLKKITYPTKGWEEFQYEGNDASKDHRFYSSSTGFIESEALVDVNPPISASGYRIKEIRTYNDNSTIPLMRKYSYIGDNGISSGISSGNEVQYSKVIEEITGKEKNEYYFTDLITNPDSLATKKYSDNLALNLNQYLNTRLPIKVSKSNERGKLYKTVKFTANNQAVLTQYIKYTNFLNNAWPVKETSNTCTTCKVSDDSYYIIAKKIQYEPSINGSAPFYIGFYQYQPVLPYLPVSIKTVESLPTQVINGNYVGGKTVEHQKFIKYNTNYLYWHPYPIETTEYLPYPWTFLNPQPAYNGKIVSKTYYPQDLIRDTSCASGNCPTDNNQVGGKFSTYKYMVDNNIIMPVIQGQLNENNKTTLTENIYTKDNSSGNLLKISKVRASLLGSNFTLNTPSSAEVEETIAYQLYDNVGNLLQSTSNTDIPTTTIWGYHQTLPIATIEGATYSQVMQAFNLDPLDPNAYLQLEIVDKSNNSTEAELRSKLQIFKNKPEFNNFNITTYTHEPLIGVKSVTSPSGIRESYNYDSTNRLEKILDTNDKTVKEFKYNYAKVQFFNEAINSKSYTKNDCPSGMLASSITYSVPAGKYISIISQIDANQQAENEGQNYANANGICNSISCSLSFNSSIGISGGGSISVQPNSYYKVSFGFSSGSNSTNLPWTTGVKVATIIGNCKPIAEYSSYNGQVYYTITTTGDVILRTHTGTVLPNNTSYSYELIFPVN